MTANFGFSLAGEIQPSAELDDVFLHFLRRFEALPNPRSVADARITPTEKKALSTWFSQQWGKPRMWCEDRFQSKLANDIFASPQEMFGGLILILASEICRTDSDEDSVWPAVTAVLKADKKSFPSLFLAGQPTVSCKNAMAAGARRLGLRNLIDRYGAQEYFDTLKLQFGFTIRGATRKLPQWLDGSGLPIAVRILTGSDPDYPDLRSNSFAHVWSALQKFRRGRASVEHTSALLRDSPWIQPDWTDDLLRVAKLRAPRPQSPLEAQEIPDRQNDRLFEPSVIWNYPSPPELSLKLNEEQIYELLGQADSATFAIDGRTIDRWTALEGAAWRGRRCLACQPPGAKSNLRPKFLSISNRGGTIAEVDLLGTALGGPLLVFDLKLGTLVELASRLDLTRDYALICDPDLSVPNTQPSFKTKERTAYRLDKPWSKDLEIVCDGASYWKPRIWERDTSSVIRLTIESLAGDTGEVGSYCLLKVTGVPDDATDVSLMVGTFSYPVVHNGAQWQTMQPVPITLGMALGEEAVRVRVTGQRYSRAVTPGSSLRLIGIAAFETESPAEPEPKWKLLNRNQPLDRGDGSGRVRAFVPATNAQLFEGSRFVGKVSARGLQIGDLHGWGARLAVRSEQSAESTLVESTEDHGRGKFLPPLFGGRTDAYLWWRTPTPLSSEHKVFVWSDLRAEPRAFDAKEISSQNDDTLWKLTGFGSVGAMAVGYKGVRIASYWSTPPTIQAIRSASTPRLFSLFRWLKLPILNSSFRKWMQDSVLQSPAEFVIGWLGSGPPSSGLVHKEAEPGLDSVVREFLWNFIDKNVARVERLAKALRSDDTPRSQADDFKSSLTRLAEICPALPYCLAGHKLLSKQYRNYVRAVAAALLHEPPDCQQLQDKLAAACRDCAALLGITPQALLDGANAFGAYLDNQASNYRRAEPDLRRLGETSRGREFLAASLLLRLIERSRF